jgi:phospholipase/carboxylesterase
MSALLADERSTDWGIPAPAVLLFLHGYGSSERDLSGLAPALSLDMPWASLRAPLELGNGGAAWFTITTPGDPDPQPVDEATTAIWDWVDATVTPGTRIVPIGFSQGGLMVSQLVRTRPGRVLAPVILGGFVQRTPQAGDETLTVERPALFWGRGAEDRVIGVPAITRTSAFLPAHSTLVERIYPGLAHGISAAELGDVRAFILDQLDTPARTV